MCQLQCQLDEGIGARPALLDQPFAKGVKWEGMQVHVICQKAGAAQGSLNDLLTLQEEEAPLSGEARQNRAGQDRTEFANVHCTFSGIFLERLPGSLSEAKHSTSTSPQEQWGNPVRNHSPCGA